MDPHCRIARYRLKSAPHLTVHVPDIPNLANVPAMMERCARDIRRGHYGNVADGVFVMATTNSPPHVFSWGHANIAESIGILTMGLHGLALAGLTAMADD